MHLSQIMNIQIYMLLHHRYKRRQDFLCCGPTSDFLPCSASKHPHTTLRKNKIPLSKFSKDFSTSAERKKHFFDHRRLKGLSNFMNLLIIPATDTEKCYRYHRNRYCEREEPVFQPVKSPRFDMIALCRHIKRHWMKRKMSFHIKDNVRQEKMIDWA